MNSNLQNPVISMLGRPLRLALIGGGPGSFIGQAHRTAALMDGCYNIVAGVLSSDASRSVAAGREMGFADRAYPDLPTMLAAEAARPDGADAVTVMTPNDTHHSYSIEAMKAGFHVICDKPLANTVDDARKVAETAQETGKVVCLTHVYSGYPLVRQARAMVRGGEIGDLRLVQVEYVHGGAADESVADDPKGPRGWKFLEDVSGPSLVLGDIGTHAHHLLRFITGVEVDEVRADVGTIVPGRKVHDFAGALLRLQGGARGIFWVSRAAAGLENSLKIRASGSRGTLEWWQEIPQRLVFTPLKGPMQIRTHGGPETTRESARTIRYGAGHPEGFPEAFANLYSDAAEIIASRIAGITPNPDALLYPDADDGVMGLRFVLACLDSSENGGCWARVPCP